MMVKNLCRTTLRENNIFLSGINKEMDENFKKIHRNVTFKQKTMPLKLADNVHITNDFFSSKRGLQRYRHRPAMEQVYLNNINTRSTSSMIVFYLRTQ